MRAVSELSGAGRIVLTSDAGDAGDVGRAASRIRSDGMKGIRDLALSGRRVFLRVDFNVPLDGGRVGDATRIAETIPTVRAILDAGGRVLCASHLGKPKGRRDPKLSLAPVASEFAALLGRPVRFADDCVGPEVERLASAL